MKWERGLSRNGRGGAGPSRPGGGAHLPLRHFSDEISSCYYYFCRRRVLASSLTTRTIVEFSPIGFVVFYFSPFPPSPLPLPPTSLTFPTSSTSVIISVQSREEEEEEVMRDSSLSCSSPRPRCFKILDSRLSARGPAGGRIPISAMPPTSPSSLPPPPPPALLKQQQEKNPTVGRILKRGGGGWSGVGGKVCRAGDATAIFCWPFISKKLA